MKRLLKILCLHGYTQNASVFSKRTAALRKSLRDVAEFEYMSAPHYADGAMPEVAEESRQLAWWNSRDTENGKVYEGIDESLQSLVKILQEKGPFDGVLGYSQGAVIATVLAAMLQPNSITHLQTNHPPLRFAIICCGFKPRSANREKYLKDDRLIEMSSLHVWGRKDKLVSPESSQLLSESFQNPALLVHEGGHYIPSDVTSRNLFLEFLENERNKLALR